MRLFLLVFPLLFLLNKHSVFSQISAESFSENVFSDSSNDKRQPFTPYIGFSGNIGGASYSYSDYLVSVYHPYTVYDYSSGNTSYLQYYSDVRLPASIKPLQLTLGGSIDVAFHRNLYAELSMNSWAPGSGNNMACIAGGVGAAIFPRGKNFSIRIGLNYFRVNRSVGLDLIDNSNKDVRILNTVFDAYYYDEREQVRKKDTVMVYDVYGATYISVTHNEVYYGLQPKIVLSSGTEDSPAILRLHLGWNYPLGYASRLRYIQHGSFLYTDDYRPPYPEGLQKLSIKTSNPYIQYQSSGSLPSFTTGFFFKIEIGIRIHAEQ